jgi:hypothetical protein
MKKVIYSLGLGVVGGGVGAYLNIPLGWLLGAMVANIVASMQGVSLGIPQWLRSIAFIGLGAMLGTAFSPELLDRVHRWTVTMAGMLCYLAIAIPCAFFYGRKVIGFDKLTAAFSSIPGGLGVMVILGASAGANPRTTALAHTARLATILMVLPFLLRQLVGIDLDVTAAASRPTAPIGLADAGMFIALAASGALVATALRLPSPYLLGPLILIAGTQMVDLTDFAIPIVFVNVTQVIIGAGIGTAFSGAKPHELFKTFMLSSGLTLLLLALAILFAYVFNAWTHIGFAALLLAFVPGGLAEIGMLALILNIDPVFVASHHAVRVLLITVTVPLLTTRWIKRQQQRGQM